MPTAFVVARALTGHVIGIADPRPPRTWPDQPMAADQSAQLAIHRHGKETTADVPVRECA